LAKINNKTQNWRKTVKM